MVLWQELLKYKKLLLKLFHSSIVSWFGYDLTPQNSFAGNDATETIAHDEILTYTPPHPPH